MRIAIVDDIAQERALLKARLEHQLEHHTLHACVFEYSRGEDFLTAAQKHPFDLVFLDIYMDGINGIETAQALRRFDRDCLLVLTTSSTDHALEGFRVRALHYLVKPYSEEDIAALIAEIVKIKPVPDKYIEIRSEGRNVRLRYQDIQYAENFQHRVYIHTADGRETVTRQTFGEFISGLKDPRFFLCSRGVIVNLEHAEDFDGKAFVFKNRKHIPVNRDLIKSAQQIFSDYVFKRGAMQ